MRSSDPSWSHVLLAFGQNDVSQRLAGPFPKFPRVPAGAAWRIAVGLVIGTDGRVRRIVPLLGSPEFTHVAIDAIRQWTYSPPVEDGEPVEAISIIEVELHGL